MNKKIKPQHKPKNKYLKRLSITVFAVITSLLIIWLVYSYLKPETRYSLSFVLNDTSTHIYSKNSTFIYGGISTKVDAKYLNAPLGLEDCQAPYDNNGISSFMTSLLTKLKSDCESRNKSTYDDFNTHDFIEVKVTYKNNTNNLLKIPQLDVYVVDGAGNKGILCSKNCKKINEDLLPKTEITNSYIIKSYNKNSNYKLIIQILGRTKQIVDLKGL